MKSLTDLISENILSTDKNSIHSYIDYFYEKEFSKYRNKEITLVELGVMHGGSIKLWDLYFPNVTIYGMDIEVKNKAFENFCNSKDNIHYIIGDSYTDEIANKIPEFDIFIDDGPHNLPSQMNAIKFYLHKMKPNGVFIIEDVEEPNYLRILKNYTQSLYTGYEFELLDFRIVKKRNDDLMLIIRKGN
jgi:SAM-dependent methyltransferase